LDCPPRQPPYRAVCSVLIEELHVVDRAAQGLPGQFTPDFSQLVAGFVIDRRKWPGIIVALPLENHKLAENMNPTLLLVIGAGLWVLVEVWAFRAKQLTTALFWSRLLAPVVSIALSSLAIYLMIRSRH
jgi:hypothetical protein